MDHKTLDGKLESFILIKGEKSRKDPTKLMKWEEAGTQAGLEKPCGDGVAGRNFNNSQYILPRLTGFAPGIQGSSKFVQYQNHLENLVKFRSLAKLHPSSLSPGSVFLVTPPKASGTH